MTNVDKQAAQQDVQATPQEQIVLLAVPTADETLGMLPLADEKKTSLIPHSLIHSLTSLTLSINTTNQNVNCMPR